MPTAVEWATETWEPVQGCTPVSEGCLHCYARRYAEGRGKRFYPDGFNKVVLHPERLKLPLTWRKPRTVFVCSRSDLFHPDVPFSFTSSVFQTMLCGNGLIDYSEQTYLLLTKRPERMAQFASHWQKDWDTWPSNVWAGVSVENQKRADERLPLLAQVPARVRFVSAEPLLGPLDLRRYLRWADLDAVPVYLRARMEKYALSNGVNWIIVGGESGPHARPVELDWVRSIIAQCREARVPCFVKQLGSVWARAHRSHTSKGTDPSEWPVDLRVRKRP